MTDIITLPAAFVIHCTVILIRCCNEIVIIVISFIMFFISVFNNERYTPGSVDNVLDCYKRTAGRGIEYKKCSIQFYLEMLFVLIFIFIQVWFH